MKNEKITERSKDFGKWYQDVVREAELADYSSVKGCIIFEANGYALWEKMQSVLDNMFKETGHRNVYLPVLIPEELLKKEGELVKGFAPEVAWVTEGGSKHLDERLAIRPTSETLFSDYYHKKVKSYRDLPLLYNQWCNVFRWEKETKPFLRSREFLWQEGHTVHETKEEAIDETRKMLNVYRTFFEEYLAIPVITGRKTEKEKFAGAEFTLTIEALMQNGVSLQSATSHYFGDKFAKAYDITFKDRENKDSYCHQTSWGSTTRMIGALIMVHSDDAGLVLPPKIAPLQVVIVPIGKNNQVLELASDIEKLLKKKNISVKIDERDKSPGFKFAEAEVNGIPLRIEIGERDLAKKKIVMARRDTREKIEYPLNKKIDEEVVKLLDTIQKDLFVKALERRNELTKEAFTFEDVEKIMNERPGFIKAMWCGDEACEAKMKEIKGTKARCILENEKPIGRNCVVCGKNADNLVVWGIQY